MPSKQRGNLIFKNFSLSIKKFFKEGSSHKRNWHEGNAKRLVGNAKCQGMIQSIKKII